MQIIDIFFSQQWGEKSIKLKPVHNVAFFGNSIAELKKKKTKKKNMSSRVKTNKNA